MALVNELETQLAASRETGAKPMVGRRRRTHQRQVIPMQKITRIAFNTADWQRPRGDARRHKASSAMIELGQDPAP